MVRFGRMTGRALAFLAFLWFLWFMNFSVRTVFSPLMPLIEDEFLVSHGLASTLADPSAFQAARSGPVASAVSGLYRAGLA